MAAKDSNTGLIVLFTAMLVLPMAACLLVVQVDQGVSFALFVEFAKVMLISGVFTALAFYWYLKREKSGEA
jgi:hypothetical protein